MKIQKLIPECKDYVWGGSKLKSEYGKKTNSEICAESWELSFHKDGLTKVQEGKTLCEIASKEHLGSNLDGFEFFPVLNKFIDAKQNLSVQVHPSDAYALKNENSFGKTEMWYIVEADEGAGIYLGFNRDITKEEYESVIQNNTLTQILNFYPVKAGECYFIPSGTVHAIGAGCLIYEIQQNSNLTYRVYDYGRGREVHIEKALAVSNLSKHQKVALSGDVLGVSKYFTVSKLNVCNNTLQTDGSTFNCVTVVGGSGEVDGIAVKKGDSLFVPANYGSYSLKGDMQIILTQIRKYYLQLELALSYLNCAIVDDNGKVLVEEKIAITNGLDVQKIGCEAVSACRQLLINTNMGASDLAGIKACKNERNEQEELLISAIKEQLFE